MMTLGRSGARVDAMNTPRGALQSPSAGSRAGLGVLVRPGPPHRRSRLCNLAKRTDRSFHWQMDAWAVRSVDPFFAADQANLMARPEQLRRQIAFLKDASDGRAPRRVIHYVPLGTTAWRETPVWPPAGVKMSRFSLAGPGKLSQSTPSARGADTYVVDFTASTGESNRWRTQLGGAFVSYEDRAAADRKLLVYAGEPVSRDMELAGRPLARLNLSVTRWMPLSSLSRRYRPGR